MGSKTNKSFTKRLKLTKKGKIIQRSPGIGHFNAKEDRKGQLKKKRPKIFNITKNKLRQFVPFK